MKRIKKEKVYKYSVIVFILLFSCSSNPQYNDDLLLYDYKPKKIDRIEHVKNRYNGDLDEFLLLSFEYFTIAYPKEDMPRHITQYLLIPSYFFFEGEKIDYFELYRYSNYSNKIKLRDVKGEEYENIIKRIDLIINDSLVNCEKSSSYKYNITYRLFINFEEFKIHKFGLDLWDESKKTEEMYFCLQNYLRTILFAREYEINLECMTGKKIRQFYGD